MFICMYVHSIHLIKASPGCDGAVYFGNYAYISEAV